MVTSNTTANVRKMCKTVKIKLIPMGTRKGTAKQERERVIQYLKDSEKAQQIALNHIIGQLTAEYYACGSNLNSPEFKERRKEILNYWNPVFHDVVYLPPSSELKSAITWKLNKEFSSIIKNGLAKGERTVTNYSLHCPIPTAKNRINFEHNCSSDIEFLEKMYTKEVDVQMRWINRFRFRVDLGNLSKSKKLRKTFAQLFPQLAQFIGGLPIVCHNRGADINIMQRCMDYYGLTGIDTANNYCTYEMTGLSLTACCAQFGINMGAHHNALDDADACAKVFLACQGAIMATTFKGGLSEVIAASRTKKFEHATLIPISDEQVQNQDTPFFHAKVVITGTFAAYPKRNELGKLLQALGADVDTAISKRTNVVVMGQGAGPAKVKKIEALRAEGYDIRIIYEEELKQILNYGED